MRYMKNCIFCNQELKISGITGSSEFLYLVNCDEDSAHQFVISQRGDTELNRHPLRKQAVIEGGKAFKRKLPTEIPQIFFDEKWELSIIKLMT